MRGYFGIGVYHPKTEMNIGTLWRSAMNFGAAFIFVIGRRYKKQPSDTTKTPLHVPLYQYKDWEEFAANIPHGCVQICVEQTGTAAELSKFTHPERAVYILGAEDHGIPPRLMLGRRTVFIDTPMCLNVAVAGSIVMYDRQTKGARP